MLVIEGEAETDVASPEFWAPLPRARGPYFLRIEVFDENGEWLTRARTTKFR